MYLRLYEDNPNDRDLNKVVDLLKKGGIIIYPTDTVYALGCDIYQHKAINKITQIKGIKPENANFSIICDNISTAAIFAKIDNEVFKLMKRALPGPYTFILPATNKVPTILENKRKEIGIRIPNNFIIKDLVKMLGNPILTTSIKDDDEIIEYTTDPELINEKYKDIVDMIVAGDYGHNIPSTVLDCTKNEITVVRAGIDPLHIINE